MFWLCRAPPGAPQCSEEEPPAARQHAGLTVGGCEVEFPFELQLRHSLTGQPDLQLQFIRVRAGLEAECRHSARACPVAPVADSAWLSPPLLQRHPT